MAEFHRLCWRRKTEEVVHSHCFSDLTTAIEWHDDFANDPAFEVWLEPVDCLAEAA